MNPSLKSSELSPSEIKNKDFKKTMLGYSPEEVVGFLDQVAKLWLKVQKREKELMTQIEELQNRIKNWESREAEIQKLKEKAQIESHQQLREAEQRAQEVRKNTEGWLAQVLVEVEEVENRKTKFREALKSVLDSHYELLKKDELQVGNISEKLSHYLKLPEKNQKGTFLS